MTNYSKTCEYLLSYAVPCGKRTTSYYPAAGGGTMALCDEHGIGHARYATRVDPEEDSGIPPRPSFFTSTYDASISGTEGGSDYEPPSIPDTPSAPDTSSDYSSGGDFGGGGGFDGGGSSDSI